MGGWVEMQCERGRNRKNEIKSKRRRNGGGGAELSESGRRKRRKRKVMKGIRRNNIHIKEFKKKANQNE